MYTTTTSSPFAEFTEVAVSAYAEESLVADDRAGLTPSQMVERKLVTLLKTNPLPVSQLSTGRRLIRSR
jgi:hypothetical protein